MKKKIITIVTMLVAICSILMMMQNKADADPALSGFYNPVVSHTPFQIGNTWVYCREKGGPLKKSVWYSNVGTYNLDLQLAYALDKASTNEIRRYIIWNSYISSNRQEPGWGYSEAIDLYAKGARFAEAYKKLEESGKDIEIEDEKAELVSYSNGKYKLGPFKLDFCKSEFSNLSELYLKDGRGNKIEIKKIEDKNGNKQSMEEIVPNRQIYVYCDVDDTNSAAKVQLYAKFVYEEVTNGTYTNYAHLGGTDSQKLVSIDTKVETKSNEANGKYIPLLMDLGGRVFLDEPSGKQQKENGCFDNNEKGVKGVKVELFKKGTAKPIKTTTTGSAGKYQFKDVSAAGEYYVRFQYNGMEYESTTYQALNKFTANEDGTGRLVDSSKEERSYATEGRNNRIQFNNKFNPVNVNTNVEEEDKLIYAYTGRTGKEDIEYYSRKDDDEKLKNINLGIMARPTFDLALKKDLYSFKVKINGIEHTYWYDGRKDEPWVVQIDGNDIDNDIRGKTLPAYQRKIRKTDLEYNKGSVSSEDMLQAEVTYVIKIKNTSNGHINGTVKEIADYYDKDYEYISSYMDEEGNVVNWQLQADTQKYHKMTAKLDKTLMSGNDTKIYVKYNLNREVLNKLLTQEVEAKKNIAEITEFSTTYEESKYDTNDKGNNDEQHLIYKEGEVAGLLDKDSHPGNYNPDTGANEDEDDTDMAPDLKLVLDNDERTIEGNVWEDSPIEEKLEANERIGNGAKDDGETGIKQVRIELINQDNDQVVDETWSSDNGYYIFKGFIPGRYYIKYYYGELEMLNTNVNSKFYTGQDYKSTIYNQEAHQADYWYKEDNRLSDAKDDWDRREEVNQYSETLRYQNATILNISDQNDTLAMKTLADNTKMFAKTDRMLMEVEYARTETETNDSLEYSVRNIDFGIIERPRAKLEIENKIAKVVITTSDNNTLFNIDEEKEPNKNIQNLSRIGKDFQFNIDNSLIHGAEITTTYKFIVKNVGEIDYNDQNYYYKGETSDESKIVKSKATQVVNYVPVNMNFYNSSNNLEGWDKNDVWSVVENKQSQLQSDEGMLVNKEIKLFGENNSATKYVDKILIAEKNSNKLISTDGLKPGEETNPEYLSITKKLSTNDDSDLRYENMIEIVEAYNEVGRRYYYYSEGEFIANIPGDLDPENPSVNNRFNGGQTDASSITGNIVPPFGKQNTVYYIVGVILIAIVLAGGIFLIKKKVVNK